MLEITEFMEVKAVGCTSRASKIGGVPHIFPSGASTEGGVPNTAPLAVFNSIFQAALFFVAYAYEYSRRLAYSRNVELASVSRRLVDAEREKRHAEEELLRIVCHEVRNPLNSVLGHLRLARVHQRQLRAPELACVQPRGRARRGRVSGGVGCRD